MARVKITEYKAKTLLIERYQGVSIQLSTLKSDVARFDSNVKYVIKVDQGIKKRGKQGLIRLNITKDTAQKAVQELADKGFDRFIAEPMVEHADDEEHYLSIERVREGVQILYSSKGGVDIEDHIGDVKQYDDISKVPLPRQFLQHIVDVMDAEHFSFVEINPLVVRNDECILLDAAVLADSAGEHYASWTDEDIADTRKLSSAEKLIADLNDGSAASFSFRVLNPNGSIWLLLSGGGASITIADEAANRNKADLIGNYGEYSGGPTREETQLYTEAVLSQAMRSTAVTKAIVIAGGVANFTDVKKTFSGVIDALTKNIDMLKSARIKVYVRRGGPNEKEGLEMMEKFLKQHGIYGSTHGSGDILTTVVDEALEYVDA